MKKRTYEERKEEPVGAHIFLCVCEEIEILWKDLLKDCEGVVVDATLVNELLEKRLMETVAIINDDPVAQGEVVESEHVEGGTSDGIRESLDR